MAIETQSGPGTASRRVRRGTAVALAALLALFGAAGAAHAGLGWSAPYGSGTYSPGEQHGGSFDCPYLDRAWIANGFAKTAARKGKSIFIDNAGRWIAAAEDTSSYTLLYRPDLAAATKKGSVKNTSTTAYSGHGAQGYDNSRWCF